MKAFIQDRERVLDSANDLLKTSVYAENLVKVIENTPKNKVFTIGVFGGWGTGKSSIIRTAQDKIEEAHKKKVRFITYDAWKYANDSFRRMFLLKVQQELGFEQKPLMQSFYANKSEDVDINTRFSYPKLFIGLFISLLLMISVIYLPVDNYNFKILGTAFVALCTLYYNILIGAIQELRVNVQQPRMFAPEQFEICFKQMMSVCLEHYSFIGKLFKKAEIFVTTGKDTIIGLEKLVIVIDNIDRCPSDMAYQLLTDIKTFLSNEEYNLVFIVPVDDEALKKHLFRRWNKQTGEDINKEKEEFLRKFFNVTLRIKPHQVTELQHFAHEINRENNLGFSNDTLAIVAKEFADNPRRIIQLLNNLSGDLALYDDVFADKYETAICAALILQEVYPDFYKRVTKDLNLVKQFDADNKNKSESDNLKGFMRIVGYTLKKVPLDDLQHIFTNTTSIFSELPTDVQKSVRSYDSEKVIEFANANEDKKNNLVDYAIESLSNDVKYGATSQTTQWIDFLSRLYKAGIYDDSRFAAIDGALSPYYKTAVPAIDKPDALCYMGCQMNVLGINALRSAIIEFLTAENAREESNFTNVLYAYYANFTSEKDCQAIAKVVEDFYDKLPFDDDEEINFTDTQKKILFGDSFVTRQTNGLTSTDDEDRIKTIIWCIKNNAELASETFTSLFSKYIELFGNTRGKKKDDYLMFISNLQVVLDTLPTNSLTNELTALYGVVTNARAIPDSSWPTHTQYDSHRSILDEVNVEEAKIVTSFCYEVMRITGGKVNVSSAISKLYTKCKDVVMEGALKIHSLGISISSLAPTLINADDYDSTNDISVLEIILTRQADSSLMLDESKVKEKIHTLVNHSNNNKVESLLKKLVSDKQILDIVAGYVSTLDSKTINNLPTSIAKFAVSTFTRENAEVYKDNVDFLILVLKQGTSIQKKEVVRLMKAKINNEVDLDNVVKILDNLVTEDQKLLKPLVSELDAIKDSESVDDKTKDKIATLVTKLSANIKKVGLFSKF